MEYFSGNQKFGGVFSRDSTISLADKFYIFNLDAKSGPGTHWVTIFNCYSDTCLYFDPFGADPPEEILKLMRQTKKRMIMNKYRIQALTSKSCGVYCVYVINSLLAGRKFINVLSDFNPSQYDENEKIIMLL